MYIFIDESGNHKQTGYSSIAMVYIESKKLLEMEENLNTIKATLNLKTFHWGKERWDVRNKFLAKIIDLNFKVYVTVFKNPFLPEKMMELALNNLTSEKKIEYLLIDGKKSKRYEQKLKKILRDKGISLRKLKTVNDKSYSSMQLADCLAGLIRRYYENKNEDYSKKWFNKLCKKEKRTLVAN